MVSWRSSVPRAVVSAVCAMALLASVPWSGIAVDPAIASTRSAEEVMNLLPQSVKALATGKKGEPAASRIRGGVSAQTPGISIAEVPGMDGFEPDNIPEQAKAMTAGAQQHSFHSAADMDWHTVDITAADAGKQFRISLAAVSEGIDTVLVVLDRDMNVVAFNDDDNFSHKTLDSTIVWFPPRAGRYYILCFEYGLFFDAGRTGNYQVSMNYVGTPAAGAEEPNNIPSQAALVYGGTTPLTVNFEGDPEWFKFNATAGQYYAFETKELLHGVDTVLWLYDTDAARLIHVNDDIPDSGGWASRIQWLCLKSGTYYVKVAHIDNSIGDGSNIYSYKLEFHPDTSFPNIHSMDAYEGAPAGYPNDSDNLFNQAKHIVTGVEAGHTHHFDGDVDWHKFDATGKQSYRIRVDFSTHSSRADAKRVIIHDSSRRLLEELWVDTPSISEIRWYCPTGGTYYVAVEDVFDGAVAPDAQYKVLIGSETQLPVIGIAPLAGDRRYETAVQVSRRTFADGALAGNYVVVATGESFPDALSAASLCGAYGSPLLLTEKGRLPSVVADEIMRLGAQYAVVIGGESAISEDTAAAIGQATGSRSKPVRIAGKNRYETAFKVAERTKAVAGDTAVKQVFIASGSNFPDALAASAWAARTRSPLLLVDSKEPSLSSRNNIETRVALEYLAVNKVYIVGGTTAVPQAIADDIRSRILARHDAVSPPVTRIGGADRYETARLIAQKAVDEGVLDWAKPALATGANFPDALAGGPSQAASGSPLLLANPAKRIGPGGVLSMLVGNRMDISEIRYLGSEGVLPRSIREDISASLNIQQTGF